jgi:hypothetical protein
VNTRHTLPAWDASASALSQRMRVSEVAALCQATALNAGLYPNGYASLTQRIVSRARINPIRVTITSISTLSMNRTFGPQAACTVEPAVVGTSTRTR